MIWCYMPVPCQLRWRWLKPCHGNYLKLVCNLMQPKAKYSQQKSWITQCMLKCRRIWCMFFMRGLPTSILADTSLGTWNSVAVWNCIIARQSLGQNSTNIGPYSQTNTWVWNCAWNSSMLLSRQPCFSVCTRWHWRKCSWKASTHYSARCCDQLLVGCEWMARIGLRRCDEWITDLVWLWNSSLFHHGRNNLPNANFN